MGDAELRIRLARKGEGKDVARLGGLALQGRSQDSATGSLDRAIDRDGGNLKVPFGRAYAFVAEEDGAVVGLMYVTPPVRLVESYEERGRAWQERLAWQVAEIQLLAVDETRRNQGAASRLLAVGEASLRQRGCGAVLVKVLASAPFTVRWYRRQGYTVLGGDEFALLRVGGQDVPISNGNDGYLSGVKRLAAGSEGVG